MNKKIKKEIMEIISNYLFEVDTIELRKDLISDVDKYLNSVLNHGDYFIKSNVGDNILEVKIKDKVYDFKFENK